MIFGHFGRKKQGGRSTSPGFDQISLNLDWSSFGWTLLNWSSFIEIGEIACAAPAWSYRGCTLNPCLRNLSLNTESEPVLHISLVNAILFDVGPGFDSISPDRKICLSDELYFTAKILHFRKYLLWKLSCFLANLLFHCLKWLAILYQTDETGTDFLIKSSQFFLSFLCFSDLKTLFNDTLDCSLSLTLLVAQGRHGRECLLPWFTGPTFILTVRTSHDWCLFYK